MNAERVASIAFVVGIFLPSVLFGIVMFIRFRRHPMIDRRKPELVLFEITFFTLSFLAYSLPFIIGDSAVFHAGAIVVINALCGWIGFFTAIYRLADLSLTLKITGEMGKTGLLNLKDMLLKENVWVKFRKYRRFPYSYVTILLVSCVMYSPMFFSVWSVSRKDEMSIDALNYVYVHQELILVCSMYAGGCALAAGLYWKVRTLGKESLGIVRELHVKIFVLVMLILHLALAVLVPGDFQVTYFRPQVVSMWIGYMVEVYVTLLNVVFTVLKDEKLKRKRAKKIEQANRRASISSSTSNNFGRPLKLRLETILHNPQLLELFRDFLKRELSLEHLLFIEAVGQFHGKYSQVDEENKNDQPQAASWGNYVQEARQIHRDFVDESGLAPVNVSGMCRNEIQAKVEQISREPEGVIDPDLFKSAYVEVSSLLAMDSLSRFKRDPNLEEYLLSIAPSTNGSSPAVTSGTSGHSLTEKEKEVKFWPPKHRKNVPSMTTTVTRESRRPSLTSGTSGHSHTEKEGAKKTVSNGSNNNVPRDIRRYSLTASANSHSEAAEVSRQKKPAGSVTPTSAPSLSLEMERFKQQKKTESATTAASAGPHPSSVATASPSVHASSSSQTPTPRALNSRILVDQDDRALRFPNSHHHAKHSSVATSVKTDSRPTTDIEIEYDE
eukprot:TRINITY_DN3400_c0_g1_i1.p1 TRINITY_DN3400_c0_g1~~TRINITY_DN3400_c0_g1_i1.p1  ORF type:complete len:668 (-),score=164.24 TRINITY_DN3400_c0_g1_i1:66-2069(-)